MRGLKIFIILVIIVFGSRVFFSFGFLCWGVKREVEGCGFYWGSDSKDLEVKWVLVGVLGLKLFLVFIRYTILSKLF